MKRKIRYQWTALFIIPAIIFLSAISSFADTVTNTYDDVNRIVREEYGDKNAAVTFTIVATAGANGSISPPGTITVNKGANQTFTMTPISGYLVKSVLVDGVSVLAVCPAVGAGTSYTFTNITTDHEIGALFTNLPCDPTNLTAVAMSSSQINLSWTDTSTNETGFAIERKTGSGGTYSQIATVSAGINTFQNNSGLTPDTAYYYRVRAYNAAGNSSYTNEAGATTLPLPPSNVTSTPVSATQINISWTGNATNGNGFKLERKTGAAGTYSEIATVGPTVTSYQNTGLTPDTSYYYRVRTYNVGGYSSYSSETNTMTLPLPPSALTAAAISQTQINLSWTGNTTNGSGFKIERKPIGGTYSLIAQVGPSPLTYSDSTGLSANTTYSYRVKTYNAGGDSSYSNEASETTFPYPPVASLSISPVAPPAGYVAPLTLTFTDSSTNIPTSWSWTFGDGTTSTLQNPPPHYYANPGTYTITLTATNRGGFNTASQQIIVNACTANPVSISGTSYATLGAAYNAAQNGDIIMIRAAALLTESLTLGQTANLSNTTSITINGGYDCAFTTYAGGESLLKGQIEVQSGTVKIRNVHMTK